MRLPITITGTFNAYQAFRAMLIVVETHNQSHSKRKIKSILCLGFGAGIGELEPINKGSSNVFLSRLSA